VWSLRACVSCACSGVAIYHAPRYLSEAEKKRQADASKKTEERKKRIAALAATADADAVSTLSLLCCLPVAQPCFWSRLLVQWVVAVQAGDIEADEDVETDLFSSLPGEEGECSCACSKFKLRPCSIVCRWCSFRGCQG
jgi:hypothetical protein